MFDTVVDHFHAVVEDDTEQLTVIGRFALSYETHLTLKNYSTGLPLCS